jgi:hypothetical protein
MKTKRAARCLTSGRPFSCAYMVLQSFPSLNVAALLDSPLHPAPVCMADMNLDAKTNGRDISPYDRAFLGS